MLDVLVGGPSGGREGKHVSPYAYRGTANTATHFALGHARRRTHADAHARHGSSGRARHQHHQSKPYAALGILDGVKAKAYAGPVAVPGGKAGYLASHDT